MENYELHIADPPVRKNGCFQKGHIPFNRNIPMKKWMDGRKIKKVLKCLELGRKSGNQDLAGSNKKEIVGIKDGKLTAFKSAVDAEKILRAKGVRISARNINCVCNEKLQTFGKYQYVRKRAGGYQWFFSVKIEKYKHLVN